MTLDDLKAMELIEELEREVGQTFAVGKSKDTIEFQTRADAAFEGFADQVQRQARRSRRWWFIAAALAGLALWPVGWGSAIAGTGAVAAIWAATTGQYILASGLERAAINVAQSKQDYFILSELERLKAARV